MLVHRSSEAFECWIPDVSFLDNIRSKELGQRMICLCSPLILIFDPVPDIGVEDLAVDIV